MLCLSGFELYSHWVPVTTQGPHKYCVVYWINIYAVDSIIHWFKQLQVPWSPVHLKEMRFIEERDHVHVDHKEFLFFCKIHIF